VTIFYWKNTNNVYINGVYINYQNNILLCGTKHLCNSLGNCRFFDSNPRICNFNVISHFFYAIPVVISPTKTTFVFQLFTKLTSRFLFSNHYTYNFMLFHLPFKTRPKNADIGQLVHYLLVYTNFNQIIIIFKKCQYFSN